MNLLVIIRFLIYIKTGEKSGSRRSLWALKPHELSQTWRGLISQVDIRSEAEREGHPENSSDRQSAPRAITAWSTPQRPDVGLLQAFIPKPRPETDHTSRSKPSTVWDWRLAHQVTWSSPASRVRDQQKTQTGPVPERGRHQQHCTNGRQYTQ